MKFFSVKLIAVFLFYAIPSMVIFSFAGCKKVPINSFTGWYHMVGSSVTYNNVTIVETILFDDTVEITKDGKALSIYGVSLGYNKDIAHTGNQISEPPRYIYMWKPDHDFKVLSFNKTLDDSAFYNEYKNLSVGGSYHLTLKGYKIH